MNKILSFLPCFSLLVCLSACGTANLSEDRHLVNYPDLKVEVVDLAKAKFLFDGKLEDHPEWTDGVLNLFLSYGWHKLLQFTIREEDLEKFSTYIP